MPTIHLSAATLTSLLHDLNHASDHDQPVSLTVEDGLMVKIGDSPWEHYASTGYDGAPSRPTLYPYVDLSTAVLPADELDDIETAPPTVIPHQYGAWVHVMDDDDWPDDDPDSTTGPVFPHLRAVLHVAREMGALWINFDCDGVDVIEPLPTFDH